jgi:deoxyadenosine/deoxycytidine kinase
MTKQFITIAGNIGVGKSTLVTLLAGRLGWSPVFEAVEENPYLADFYGDMPRWSFQSQIFFLSKRVQQHHALLRQQDSVIQDRSVYEDAEIFARNLYRQGAMTARDWHCYYDLYQTLAQMLPAPQLLVYLQASVPTLRRRIQQRGRVYEQNISEAYLGQLNELYEEWAERVAIAPVLIINTDNLDYVQYGEHLDLIWERIAHRLQGKDFLALGGEVKSKQ